MRINTNVSALTSYHSLANITGKLEKSVARLSTGLKIVTAADDAAGLAVTEKMNAQIRGLNQAYANAQDGISLLQTADGALDEVQSILQRMRELSVQSANDTLTANDREYIQLEIDQLSKQIDDISTQTQFNKKKILNGDSAVLWSTSTSDINVIVNGTLRWKDQFGTVQSADGNYKITFNTKVNGTESVHKSNIFSMKHGTKSTVVDYNVSSNSGLLQLSAMNMVEGNWRLETREVPFGGVTYFLGNDIRKPSEIGGAIDASNAPSVVAPGEYDIRLSNKVPMMAEFDQAYTDLTVDGIGISSLGTTRDFDAKFATKINETGSGTTMPVLYDDAAGGVGGTATVSINGGTDANVFTRYEVTATDARDSLNEQIQINESYKTARDARIGLTLTYNSGAQPASVANFTYSTAGTSSIGYTSTWRTSVASVLEYTLHHDDGAGNIWDENGSIGIAANSSLEEIEAAINGKGIDLLYASHTAGSTLSVGFTAGASTIESITFKGDLADDLKMNDTVVKGATPRDFLTGKAFEQRGASIQIAAGATINAVASELDKISGISAEVIGGSADAQIRLTQTGTGALGNNEIIFDTVTGTNAFAELGISNILVGPSNGSQVNGTATVMNNHDVDITNLSNATVTDIAARLSAIMSTVSGGGITANVNVLGELTSFNIQNTSKYNIKVSGGAIDELTTGAPVGSPPVPPLATGLSALRSATSVSTNGVYNGIKHTVNVYNERTGEVDDRLNTELNKMFNADGLAINNGIGNCFDNNGTAGENSHSVRLQNIATTGYNIELTDETADPAHGPLDEMWSGPRSAVRGATIQSDGMTFDWTHDLVGAVAGAEMADIFDAINNSGTNPSLKNLTATWITDPTTHWGQMMLTNNSNNDSGKDRRVYQLRTSGTDKGQDHLNGNNESGTRQLTNGALNIEAGASGTSKIWQTRDAIQVKVTAQGNRSNGELIDITRTIGGGTTAASYDRRGDATDWLWEGDIEAAGNAARLNAQIGNSISSGFFTGFQVADNTAKAANIDKGDSWILFTQAQTAANDATLVSVKVGDSRTGDQTEVTYAFNNGALSGDKVRTINQMLHIDKTEIELLQHHIDFGVESDNKNAEFSYGERPGAGKVDEWKNGNTTDTDAWDSHTYYGDETTYYFQNTMDPASVLHNIKTHKQNDINASLMFTYDNGVLKVQGRGVAADGSSPAELDGQTVTVITQAEAEAAARGAELEIFGIRFTDFNIDWSSLSREDKFVVNVAAAAKIETFNTDGDTDKFMSYENVSITGDPFQQGNERTGSSAQYRLKDGVGVNKFSGTSMNMLGFFVSPVNGSNATRGVGYYDGSLQLTFDTGFNDLIDMTVGVTSDSNVQDPTAHRMHAEVNYQGKTQYSAGALVTSGYFMSMETNRQHVLADYVRGIGYSDYQYEMRDGRWHVANTATNEKYTKMNGSMVFDVVDIEGGAITFRVQGRFIDRNGNEYYGEEEKVRLFSGANTERNTSVDPPIGTGEEDVEDPVRLFSNIKFADQEYGGIFLNEFTLGDASLWTVGDRFTVTITASGFSDGESIDDQNKDLSSSIDELNIFSDNRGSTMPHSFRFNDGVLDNSTTDLRIYQLSNNMIKEDSNNFYRDQVMDGTLSLTFGEFNPPAPGGADTVLTDADGHQRKVNTAASFEVVYGQGEDFGVAHYYTNVRDIAQFYDKNGRYILDGENEQIVIRQGDNEVRVNVTSGMELGGLTNAMSESVWSGLLHQHEDNTGLKGETDLLDMKQEKPYMVSKDDKYNIVKLVNNVPGDGRTNTVVGTVVAHSVLSGKEAALEFSGSEDIMKAFNFTTIQQGMSAEFTANVADAHTGNTVTAGTKVVAGAVSNGLIHDAVSLNIDGDIGILRSVYDKTSGTFKLDLKDQFSHNVHLADNTTTLQIGANEGENMCLSLGEVSSESLEVGHLSLRTREGAARAVTQIDNAITIVSKQRAIIGAQINRLEHTMANLANSSINLENSMSRIKDADIAKEMMSFAKFGVISNAASSILAQANQMSRNVLAMIS